MEPTIGFEPAIYGLRYRLRYILVADAASRPAPRSRWQSQTLTY